MDISLEQSEINRRVAQAVSAKRSPAADLEKAIREIESLRKKFRDSQNKAGVFSATASDNYARGLREIEIAREVLRLFENQKEVA